MRFVRPSAQGREVSRAAHMCSAELHVVFVSTRIPTGQSEQADRERAREPIGIECNGTVGMYEVVRNSQNGQLRIEDG